MPAYLPQQLKFIYSGAAVRRFHTHNMHDYQTVGAHSFGVAAIYGLLAGERATVEGYRAALHHDLAEQWIGDIPSPAKRSVPGLRDDLTLIEVDMVRSILGPSDMGGEDCRLVKLADAMDGALHCIRERAMGNVSIEATYATFMKYIEDLVLPDSSDSGWATAILEETIEAMWHDARGGKDPFLRQPETAPES